MDKKAKLLDRLQNLAIAVLSLSFLFLLVQTPLFGDTGDTTIASTVRGWFTDRQTSAAEEPDSLAALAVPVRIVQSNDFIRSGLDALTTADDAFETVGSFLGEAIGSARGISSVSENTFLSALDGSGLYFAFACDLPLEVLSARLGVQSPTARQLDVRRCLLGLDGEDTATLYLQDTKQGVYRFSTAVSAASVRDYLESQDGGNADFARSLGEGYTSLSPYTLVFDSVSARRELSAANALSDYPSEELLRRAEFNPHTKDRYVESSGTEVVIEGQRKLYLHPDGMLSYSGGAAADGSLFAVAAADAAHISRAELCAAARGLIGALTQGRIGDAALFLSGIESDDDGATVFFDYMAGGTPIRFSDGSHAAEVRIEGQSITAFSLRLRRYAHRARFPAAAARALARHRAALPRLRADRRLHRFLRRQRRRELDRRLISFGKEDAMNTARLKNIVILILLLANAFLLVLLFSRRAEENASHERSVAQLTALLNADGIAFDSALLDGLPDTVLSVQPARDLAAEQALAEGIIGSVTSIDSGGGIYRYYSSDGLNSGSCLIRSGGALEAAVSRAVDDPAEFCADLCVPLGYRTFDVLSDGARTVITASRFVGELEVCNASLIFTFSGSTLTTVTGTFLPPIDTSESGETALDAVTALVRFLDYRNASGAVCTGITWLSAGYLVQSTTSAPLQLVPVLRVDTDVYSYYVNIVSGEVSRVSA